MRPFPLPQDFRTPSEELIAALARAADAAAHGDAEAARTLRLIFGPQPVIEIGTEPSPTRAGNVKPEKAV